MTILDKLEKKFGKFTLPHLLPILLAGQVMTYFALSGEFISNEFLPLNSTLLKQGEYWRALTFMLDPMNAKPLFFALFISITYLMGSALESQWGEFRFGLYIGSCWLATVLVSFLLPMGFFSNVYIFGSIVMAFAWVFPDFEIRVFFLIPVKVRYIGYVYWAMYALELIGGSPSGQLSVLAAVFPFFLFFGGDFKNFFKQKKRSAEFKRKVREDKGTPFHVCGVCGRDDLKNLDLAFRYEEGNCICEICLQERNGS